MTEQEAMNIMVRSGAKWVDEALRDNPDGPIVQHTTRTKTEIEYEVTIGYLDDRSRGRLIWCKTVTFGHDEAHCSAGRAFVEAGREQDAVAFAALELMELRHGAQWNGLCPAGKHGLDFEGQRCDLCATATGAQT